MIARVVQNRGEDLYILLKCAYTDILKTYLLDIFETYYTFWGIREMVYLNQNI
jgi:hypothetical protein